MNRSFKRLTQGCGANTESAPYPCRLFADAVEDGYNKGCPGVIVVGYKSNRGRLFGSEGVGVCTASAAVFSAHQMCFGLDRKPGVDTPGERTE